MSYGAHSTANWLRKDTKRLQSGPKLLLSPYISLFDLPTIQINANFKILWKRNSGPIYRSIFDSLGLLNRVLGSWKWGLKKNRRIVTMSKKKCSQWVNMAPTQTQECQMGGNNEVKWIKKDQQTSEWGKTRSTYLTVVFDPHTAVLKTEGKQIWRKGQPPNERLCLLFRSKISGPMTYRLFGG